MGLVIAVSFVTGVGALLHARGFAAPGLLAAAVLACIAFLLFSYRVFMAQTGARRRAERRLVDLAEHFPGALFRYRQRRDGRSRYEFVSGDVAGLLGTDRAAAMGNPQALLQQVLPEDRPRLLAAIRAAARKLGRFEHEFRVRLGGDVRWVRSTASLRMAPDGSVLWNGFWSDVTAQKLAELERDRFFTVSLDLLCVAGMDGYFKRLNPAFTEALGWSLQELMSRPFIEFVHPDDVAATLKAIADGPGAGGRIQRFENRYLHKNGSWRVLAWRTGQEVNGLMYATARDVTDEARTRGALVKAKEAADAANRAKSTFLATMSHEIRTPLNGVLGMLELLGLTRLDDEQRRTVETVRQSGDSLKRIIDDILEFSKIEAGRLDIQAEASSVADVVTSVRDVYATVAASKGLQLELQIDSRISPALVVDALRLQQILNNLVSNALKFTPSGSVTLAAEWVGHEDGVEHVRFVVTDTGIGVAPERQRALFEPFTQAESNTTRRFGGTGLGLAISRRLAELMSGEIRMESEVGKGTRMTLLLPMPVGDPADLPAKLPLPGAAAATPRPARRAPSREQARAENTLILVVDDHATNREVLARQLGVLGYATECAENGADALRFWQRDGYGLMLVDCNMPVMDGYEFTRRVREDEARKGMPRTPIIACTANALRGEAENCLSAGMDGVLTKPVRLVDLQKKIGAWLPLPHEPAVAAPVTAPAADGRVTLDRAVLDVVSGGNIEMEREILRDFRAINDADADELKAGVESSDAARVGRSAHRMKGAARMIGAGALAETCERIEKAARAEDWTTIRESLAPLGDALARLNGAIGDL